MKNQKRKNINEINKIKIYLILKNKVMCLYNDKFNNKRAFITLWRSCLNQT